MLNEIKLYTEEKGKNFEELNDEGWVADLAFLVGVTGHLINLNKQLQRKDELITDIYDSYHGLRSQASTVERPITIA